MKNLQVRNHEGTTIKREHYFHGTCSDYEAWEAFARIQFAYAPK